MMKKNAAKMIAGLVIFVTTMLYIQYLAYPMQMALHLAGILPAEMGLVVIALLGCKLADQPPRQAFPIHKPTKRQLACITPFFIAMYAAGASLNAIQSVFWPEQTAAFGEGMGQSLSGASWGLYLFAVFCVGILPGICEETLHRGFLLSTLDGIKSAWPRVVIMGVAFGVFHWDPYRFLYTMAMGMILTYLLIKTGNLLITMICHAMVNTFSLLLIRAADIGAARANGAAPASAYINMAVFFFVIAAVFMLIGMRVLNGKARDTSQV